MKARTIGIAAVAGLAAIGCGVSEKEKEAKNYSYNYTYEQSITGDSELSRAYGSFDRGIQSDDSELVLSLDNPTSLFSARMVLMQSPDLIYNGKPCEVVEISVNEQYDGLSKRNRMTNTDCDNYIDDMKVEFKSVGADFSDETVFYVLHNDVHHEFQKYQALFNEMFNTEAQRKAWEQRKPVNVGNPE